mmetsp:Transcript_25244/g.86452  ORF Transcript_25244/g.86452 Transcript_25244/m.86452 type:complete len:159 (-) Transcript_25244:224-700(-)|eukprot:CAMPEP_0183796054 /NCGR_PEP_ID=MMETSP0803_2-20130417/7635_1 /TAXON_ID=195967 /ORGANISM="Crustomastix stigmata, Strain CCMP3273" /LENGTH=158 /DNA_ID=CAMNT_0026040647 /DNA_START=46 /DNA_END=522 /DNA_ORIENTATION=+
MKPDWDKLGKKYAEHDSVLIVDVDCTADGGGTCQKMGVKGYPTIKYFMAGDKKGKDYNGGREYAALQSFVESKLNKPVCNALTKKGCSEKELTYVEKVEAYDAAALEAELATKAEELKALKKERADAEKELKERSTAWKKKEVALGKAQAILKQLQKK